MAAFGLIVGQLRVGCGLSEQRNDDSPG